jgi:hypothetical protein
VKGEGGRGQRETPALLCIQLGEPPADGGVWGLDGVEEGEGLLQKLTGVFDMTA